MKLAQRWKAYAGPTDERVEAESNRVYKVGFVMLSFGVLVYMYYDWALKQAMFMRDVMAGGAGHVELTSADLFLYGWFALTMLVGIALLCRKGFSDDNRFAEADKFPVVHYTLVLTGFVVVADMLTTAIRVLAEFQVLGAAGIAWWSVAFGSVPMIVVGIPFGLLVFWVSFSAARSRRRRLELSLGD